MTALPPFSTPNLQKKDNGAIVRARPLGELNGRAPGVGAYTNDYKLCSGPRTLEEREENVADRGAALFAKEHDIDCRDQLLSDREAADRRVVEELDAREVLLARRESSVIEKEQELYEERATAMAQFNAAKADAQDADIALKANSDAATVMKKQRDEADARAARAEDDALARIAGVQTLRSATEHLRAESALKAAEAHNSKEELLALQASRRQAGEELEATNAELIAKTRQIATMKDGIKTNRDELASVRLCAERFEEELHTLRAALHRGGARSSSAASPPPVEFNAAPARMRRMCEEPVCSRAVPPLPPHTRSRWISPAPWSWLRSTHGPRCGEQFVPFPVRLPQESPWPLAWVRGLICCRSRRQGTDFLYAKQR
jgi:hypothetical protein